MSQNDLVIANQDFPSFRSDLNAALQAQASFQSGASAPGTTYAYMYWADTTNGVLWQRDSTNSSWVLRATLSTDLTPAKTTTYTVLLGDHGKVIECNATGGAFTVNLTAAATLGDGFEITLVKTDSSANAVTIDGNSSETINGATTIKLFSQWDSATLKCNGSSFEVVAIRNSHNYQAFPSNPTGTTSTSTTFVMAGLAGTFTPNTSGVLLVSMTGTMANTGTGGCAAKMAYGTGSAPANADAATGTQFGNLSVYSPTVANQISPFSCTGVITGLTLGTAYWLDLQFCRFTANGTANVANVGISAVELN